MYAYIKGVFEGISKDYIIVENSGIGYKIYTSGSTMAKMPKIGDEVKLYIQQIVREDFLGLYGFLTEDELRMFNLLLTINGVGAKACLSLLSICGIKNLKYAILIGDEKTLVRAPGIGKKIAQRIILEIKDKLNSDEFVKEISYDENSLNEVTNNDRKLSEVMAALLSLGYSEKEAEKAINSSDKNESIENIIKNCLKFLMN